MHSQPAPTTPDEYADWINARIGAEVRERRESLRLSAYAMGRVCGVSDQTILNIEQGLCPNGCWTGTLARMCLRFGTTLSELIEAAERRGR
jgi:transcriptional regulator with XRE-family HTH domain